MSNSLIKSHLSQEKSIKFLVRPITEPNAAAARMYMSYFSAVKGIEFLDKLQLDELNDINILLIINAADLNFFKMPLKFNLVVFITDMIRMDKIAKMASQISLIVTTSALQSRIISSVLSVECFTALEPIDPYYKKLDSYPFLYSSEVAKVLLFGYANSLERTSSHLAPFIDKIDSRFETIIYSESIPPSFRKCKSCHFLNFSKIQEQIGVNFCYVILSDIPVDLTVSTLAKSDNKLISSIKMGFLPLIAKDSRYLKWLPEGYPYTFSNPQELVKLVNIKLNIEKDINYFKTNLAHIPVLYHNAHLMNAHDLTLTLDRIKAKSGDDYPYTFNSWPGEFSYGLKDSLHDLRKSFSQTLRNRLIRLWHFIVS
jgi:hypothetical protein